MAVKKQSHSHGDAILLVIALFKFAKGAFLLAKVDVDAQGVGQALLQAVKSQGIPTVVGFRDGAAVDMFIGAYPEPAVNETGM